MVKVISLSEEAYSRLKSIKGNRSFSEVVVNLTDSGRKSVNILQFAGIWANRGKEIDNMKKMIERDRQNFKLREVKF